MTDRPYLVAWGIVHELPVRITVGAWWQNQEAVRAQALDMIFDLGADDAYKDALRRTLVVGTCGAFTEVCLGGKDSPVEACAGLLQDLRITHLERYHEHPEQYNYLGALADAEVQRALQDVAPLLPASIQAQIARLFVLHEQLQSPLLGTGLPGDPALSRTIQESQKQPGE